MDKTSLRREALSRRDALSRNPEDAIRAAVLFFDTVKPVAEQIVAAYWPQGSELDTRPLIGRLLDNGITVALPAMREGSRVLEFLRWDGKAPLVEGKHRIPQPAKSEAVIPNIVVVPLVAFDTAGHRLGYGGGYYDATLAALGERGKVTAIGLGYAEQEVAALPAEVHDQMLEIMVTPKRVTRF